MCCLLPVLLARMLWTLPLLLPTRLSPHMYVLSMRPAARVQGQYEMDVATFCERSVDVMGEESDHIHAQALTDAVQVGAGRQAGSLVSIDMLFLGVLVVSGYACHYLWLLLS
jgi:hypothetical protein